MKPQITENERRNLIILWENGCCRGIECDECYYNKFSCCPTGQYVIASNYKTKMVAVMKHILPEEDIFLEMI